MLSIHPAPGARPRRRPLLRGRGTFSENPDTGLTLIEEEAVEAMARQHGLRIDPGEAGRNLVTRGLELPRGARPAEPCAHLGAAGRWGVLQGLLYRGVLRAQVLTEGVLRTGDEVEGRPVPCRRILCSDALTVSI